MKPAAALFKERLVAALECGVLTSRAEAVRLWTAERVSEYLRARLDAERPEEGGPE